MVIQTRPVPSTQASVDSVPMRRLFRPAAKSAVPQHSEAQMAYATATTARVRRA